MSRCLGDLYDHGLVEGCSNCKNKSLKSNFRKRSKGGEKSNDGFHPQCKFCMKE